jgi:hypothetical protein
VTNNQGKEVSLWKILIRENVTSVCGDLVIQEKIVFFVRCG